MLVPAGANERLRSQKERALPSPLRGGPSRSAAQDRGGGRGVGAHPIPPVFKRLYQRASSVSGNALCRRPPPGSALRPSPPSPPERDQGTALQARVIASRPFGTRWVRVSHGSKSKGVGRQVASSQVYRMPARWRPARRFRFAPAPHSCLGASPTGLSPSRLLTSALRWSCQNSAVVQSGRASGEHTHHRWREPSCAGSTSRAAALR